MKELKLKAWHKAEKKMCDVKVVTFGVGAFLIGVKKGEDYIQGDLLIHTPEEGRFCMNDEFEFLEFTGLKDKNGIDIYIGDIRTDLAVVEWNQLHCGFGWFRNGYCLTLLQADEYDKKGKVLKSWQTFDEIIGNIYQNQTPE